MRNTLVASAFTMLSIATASAQLTIPKEYLPEVHGTIRGKYEVQTTNGMQRFQVRNARVSLDGKVLPVIAYKAEIDLSDEEASRCWMHMPALSPMIHGMSH